MKKKMKFTQNSIKNILFGNRTFSYIKEHWKAYGIIWILYLCLLGVTYIGISTYLLDKAQYLIKGKYYQEYSKLDKIKLSYQLDYFSELFGKPLIKNMLVNGDVEYLFVGRGYVLQLVTSSGESVIGIGITCTEKDFNYKIGDLVLCKSHLSEIDSLEQFSMLNKAEGFVGAKIMSYFESYGGYGVDGYRYSVLGVNPIGYMSFYPQFGDLDLEYTGNVSNKDHVFSGKTAVFRKESVINTYFSSLIIDGPVERGSGEIDEGVIGPSPFLMQYGRERK